MFCREWLAQLEQHYEQIHAAGLRVVVVGLGKPKHAQRYCPMLAPRTTCLVGQGTGAHRAYGLRRGSVLQLAGPQVLAAGWRKTVKGTRQGKATGDAAMLSGTFVVGQNGLVHYAYYGGHAGDHPDLGRLLEQWRQVPPAG